MSCGICNELCMEKITLFELTGGKKRDECEFTSLKNFRMHENLFRDL